MNNNIVIREATANDAEELLAFTKQVGGETNNLSFGSEGVDSTVDQERRLLENMHETRNSMYCVACIDGRIIGTCSLLGDTGRKSHRAELGICILKSYWGMGIGSSLIQTAFVYASRKGIEYIDLVVRSDNARAIHLYKKFGFQQVGVKPGYYKLGSDYIDFDMMCKDLR